MKFGIFLLILFATVLPTYSSSAIAVEHPDNAEDECLAANPTNPLLKADLYALFWMNEKVIWMVESFDATMMRHCGGRCAAALTPAKTF